jgi:hypothetical protein
MYARVALAAGYLAQALRSAGIGTPEFHKLWRHLYLVILCLYGRGTNRFCVGLVAETLRLTFLQDALATCRIPAKFCIPDA